jgi:leucyl aminopeptidase
VFGVFEPRKLSDAARGFDAAFDGLLSGLLRRGDMEGECGQMLLIPNPAGAPCERVLLVGCGKEAEFSDRRFREVTSRAALALHQSGAGEATSFLPDLTLKGRDTYWKVRQTIETTDAALYLPDKLKSKKDKVRKPLRRLTINVQDHDDVSAAERAVGHGCAVAAGVMLARELGNLPGNVCTPGYLASQARALARQYKEITVDVLGTADMKKLGMNALLSVARGSREPPRLIVLKYNGGGKGKRPVVLVGKGVTFDSGGISIKPGPAMDEMKFDMCGAASVLGTLKACAESEVPVNITGVIPSTENLPDGNASKPGDIVRSLSGQTIEILNTDAEGRLILCDALTYSERFNPDVVIDIATLTGACVIALGNHAAGLLGNDTGLCRELIAAGNYSGDRAWELPLWDDYQEQLKSNFADMANIGGREGGTITAACFLSRYTEKFRWAHLDIAGVAWLGGKEKGATGRPVPLLTQYLLDRCTVKDG